MKPHSELVQVSVVVATFNRKESLCELLDSLGRQTLPESSFEVIVVSDGSTDGTVDLIRRRMGSPRNIVILDLKNGGPAAARNAGAGVAQGRYLAFTDDDCIAAPDWVQQIVETFECTGAVAVQGRTTTDRRSRSPLTHQMEILSPWLTAMPTCNAAYRKDIFDAIGGFDDSFPYPHDEDADLAWRAEEAGKIVFAPRVHIVHPPRKECFAKRARWVRGFESDFLLFHKNPDKYRRYISSSPWRTIYWNLFVLAQLDMVKSSCRFLVSPFKPQYLFVGIGLAVTRWIYLLGLWFTFARADRYQRERAIGIR